MSLLALAGVTAIRGGRTLFEALDLTLTAGDAALATGPNGAGKTTLLKIAAGLGDPDAGTVARADRLAWLGESAALDGERTLVGSLRFWAALDGRPDPAGRVAIGLAALALAGLATVPVRLLSSGQRRRAALARVVASATDLWLLDEPGNGLDAAAIALLEAAIATHRTAGGAVLIATHQPLAVPGAQTVRIG